MISANSTFTLYTSSSSLIMDNISLTNKKPCCKFAGNSQPGLDVRSLLLTDRIDQSANSSPNIDADIVTIFEVDRGLPYKSNAFGRTCHDYCPWLERSSLGEERNGLPDSEKLVAKIMTMK